MTVILLRHGRSTSNVAHTLAGRSPGVELDEKGQSQADALPGRLAPVPVRAIVSSPLLRCKQTVAPLAAALDLTVESDNRLAEVDYGEWTGRAISELFKEPLWKVVQAQPSAAHFPHGEGLAQVQARAVAAIRERDRRYTEEHGDCVWVACTHGDVIKAVLADALGMHLDVFQRIVADPASISVVRYTELRPFVLHMNHTGPELSSALVARPLGEKTAPDETSPDETSPDETRPDETGPETTGDAVVGGTTD